MINITSLDELSSEDVLDTQEYLTQLVQDKYPNLDLKRGVLADLVQYVNAIYITKANTELERWRASRSLLAINEDPTLADDDAVDHIMSNYLIDRASGTAATGNITLEFSEDLTVAIPIYSKFTCDGVTYQTTQTYAVYSSTSTQTTLADRILKPFLSGNYGCSIPVVATTTGVNTKLEKGTSLSSNTKFANLVKVYATDTFAEGTDAETNTALVSKLKTGVATPTWGTRDNINALLTKNATDTNITSVSVIGMGDAEMRRDAADIIPISCGGYVDVYTKSNSGLITKTLELTASALSISCDTITWSIQIPASTFPGFWRVIAVRPNNDLNDTTYEITSQTIKSSNSKYTALDAAYSIYQTATVIFTTDLITGIVVGSTRTFNCTLLGMPNVDKITNILTDEDIKPISCDVLVKAAVPCITSITVFLTGNKLTTVADTQKENIKTQILTYVNSTGFCGELTSSDLAGIIREQLTEDQSIQKIQLESAILAPDGSLYREVSYTGIKIPDIPEKLVSSKTTVFFTGADSVNVVVG